MKLFEILQGGFHSPLSAVQIAGLFDAGCPDRQSECTPTQRTQWLTVEALFPPMHYDTSREFVGHSRAARNAFRLSLPAAMALIPLAAVATAVAGYLLFGAQPSVASPIEAVAGSPAALSSPVLAKKQTKTASARARAAKEQHVEQGYRRIDGTTAR